MKYLIIFIIMAIFGRTTQESNKTSEVEIVELFIEKVKNNDTADLSEYFSQLTDTQKQNGAEEFRANLLTKIQTKLKGNSYKVFLYSKSNEERLKLGEGIDSKEVVIVKIKGEKNSYFNVRNKKIKSMTPMIKGNLIVGWI